MKIRILSLILAILLLCGATSTAFASGLLRASLYFQSYSAALTKGSGGSISVKFSVTGVGTSSQLGVSAWYVQRYNGSGWDDVTSAQGGSIGTNTASHTFSRSFTGTVGDTYRVKVLFYCANSNGTDAQTYFSSGCTAIK